MEMTKPSIAFAATIFLIGLLTTFTDLRSKKIYNLHLIIGAVLGLGACIYAACWAHENILTHFINATIAFIIGFCFHRYELWRGGDAKLFTLYAFLMPPLAVGTTLYLSTINLFACTFIAGSIVLLPIFIRDIMSNKLFSAKNLEALARVVLITIFVSWLSFPIYHFAIYYFAKILHSSFIFLTITYFIFSFSRRYLKKISNNYFILIGGIVFGFFMRLWFDPSTLSWPALPYSILKIGLYSALSAMIYGALENLKDRQDRVAFAPLLFMGCVLSYTPFLTWILNWMSILRR